MVRRRVSLKTLLTEAGHQNRRATLIKFHSDGYRTLTVQELSKDRRYRFPNFKEAVVMLTGIFRRPFRRIRVETILGLVSAEGR